MNFEHKFRKELRKGRFVMGRFFMFLAVAAFFFGCNGGDFSWDGDVKADGDSDGDIDSDIDVDGDGDMDSDSDSDIDAGDPCIPGDTVVCGETDIGECQLGQHRCFPHGVWSACEGDIGSQPEENFGCDNLDNDCDGEADEHLIYTELAHCGACNYICGQDIEYPEVENYACREGICVPKTCVGSYFDLDEMPENGCEHFCATGFAYEMCEPGQSRTNDENCNGHTEEECGRILIWWDMFADPIDECGERDEESTSFWRFYNTSHFLVAGPPADNILIWSADYEMCCSEGISHGRWGVDYAFCLDNESYLSAPGDTVELNRDIRDSFTWSIWVNPEEFEEGDYAIYRRGSSGELFTVAMTMEAGHQKWQVCVAEDACGTGGEVILGEWSQIVITYERPQVTIYSNGVDSGSFIGEFVPGGEVRIGGDGADHNFRGGIDAVGLFSDVKSIEWVRHHYRLPSYVR